MTFREFLVSLGLKPGAIVDDGEWKRCRTEDKPRKKNGQYILDPGGLTGAAINYATMPEHRFWRADDEKMESLSRRELEELRRRNEKRQREREREKEKASREAMRFYYGCQPLRGGHPYLEEHGLGMTGCGRLRVDDDGWLVVATERVNPFEFMTVQRISRDGDKRFWPGAPFAGSSFLARHRRTEVTILCEGLATGLALLNCVMRSRVIVAFSAQNMYHDDVLARVPDGMMVVAADNDHETETRTGENPGVEAAKKAAEKLGCGVAIPEGVGTDWCDFRQERFRYHKDRLDAYGRDYQAQMKADGEVSVKIMRAAR